MKTFGDAGRSGFHLAEQDFGAAFEVHLSSINEVTSDFGLLGSSAILACCRKNSSQPSIGSSIYGRMRGRFSGGDHQAFTPPISLI